jgi:predicted permease
MDRDLQYGLRQLRRNKFFSGIVIALLAIGIGANTLVFSLVNELLLKPLPVRNPRNLYLLERVIPDDVRPGTFFQYLVLQDVLQKSSLFSAAVAEQEWTEDQILPMSTGGAIRLVMAQMVSPNYFTELGVRAVAGRVLTEADAANSSTVPAALSYQFWQSQFGGSRDIIGRSIHLKGIPFVVVGVLPREFHSSDIDRAPDVRLPISAAPALLGHTITEIRENRISFRILARLAPGVSPARAADSIFAPLLSAEDSIRRAWNAYRKDPMSLADLDRVARADPGYRLRLEPVGRGISQLRDRFSQALRLLLGGVVLLLLAVCANVAGLLMAKADRRRREIGIRVAVGAGRRQLIGQLLIENLLLALPGALLGALLAFAVSPSLVGLLPPPRDYAQLSSPQILTVVPDARVLLFAVLLTAVCVLAFGLVPAWRATGLSRTWGRAQVTRSVLHRAPWRDHRSVAALAPLAVQVGFCVVLLSAAALMLRTFWNLEHLETGLDRAHIVEFTVDPMDAGFNKTQSGSFYRELQERVAALPGVRSVAYASRGLMRNVGFKTTLTPQGVVLPASTFLNASSNEVTPEYFDTLGLPIVAGRNFERGEAGKKLRPVVVNRAFADLLFPRQSPVSKLLVQGTDGRKPPDFEIVGVTANAKYRSMREPDPPTVYKMMDPSQGAERSLLMHVRTRGAPASIINAVREAIAGLDPRVPLVEVLTLDQEIRTSLWQERLVALLSAFFGAVSIVLAGIGLYGSLTYSVAQRTHELGIRVAVGARVRHIVQTVCAPFAMAVAAGLAAGVLAATFLVGLTGRLLFGVEPLDPRSFAAAACFVVLCAVAAAVLPAWRAIRIAPSSALRED